MDDATNDLAVALTAAARTLHGPGTLEDTLDTIVQTARLSIPGFDHIGISVTHKDGSVTTMSGTDQLVWELDALQYSVGQGPCLESIDSAGVVVVEHARDDARWPRFMPAAVERGLRSQLAIRLFTDETLGGLNLYSTTKDTIEPDAVHIADLFATHAAIALGRARQENQLNQALLTRKAIGQAMGIIMERYKIDEHRAFRFLARVSQDTNVKLRDVAEQVISTVQGGPVADGPAHAPSGDGGPA